MRTKLLLQLCFILACTTGCGHAQSQKVYSEAELNTLIVPGMSLADVTNKFGPPGSTVEFGQITHLTYSFPLQARPEQGDYLAGFGIDIKDGRVVRWSPDTAIIGKTIKGGEIESSFGEQSFQIYVATDKLTNLLATLQSKGSADASELRAPNLVFRAKVFAGTSDDERPGEQTVILVLSDQDASRWKEFTQFGTRRRLLIVCRSKLIAAPMVSEQINTTKLRFTVKTNVLDSLRTNN